MKNKDLHHQSGQLAMINEYQKAYWLATTMQARNAIALELWKLRSRVRTFEQTRRASHIQIEDLGVVQRRPESPELITNY